MSVQPRRQPAAHGQPASEALGRVTSFSDGVFAIAITLLVLEVHEGPAGQGSTLQDRLVEGWPSYLAFGLSFLVIGLMWLNHFRLLRHIAHLSSPGVLANLTLLATVSFLPFPTAVLAQHVADRGSDATTAAAFYALACLGVSGSFFVLVEVIRRDGAQHRDKDTRARLGRLQVRGWFAPVAYVCAIAVSFFSPRLALALFVATPFLFVVEPLQQ